MRGPVLAPTAQVSLTSVLVQGHTFINYMMFRTLPWRLLTGPGEPDTPDKELTLDSPTRGKEGLKRNLCAIRYNITVMLELDSQSALLIYLTSHFSLSILSKLLAVTLNPGCILKSPGELFNNNDA